MVGVFRHTTRDVAAQAYIASDARPAGPCGAVREVHSADAHVVARGVETLSGGAREQEG